MTRPKTYDFRDAQLGVVVPIATSTGKYYLEKVEEAKWGEALNNWTIHTTEAMGEKAVQLINLIPNKNGKSSWTERADMKEQGGIGYKDQEGVIRDLGRIVTILDHFTVREEAEVPIHVTAA